MLALQDARLILPRRGRCFALLSVLLALRLPYRMLTARCSVFLHAGVIHLLFNLLFQLQIGMTLRAHIRHGPHRAVYFGAGIGGNIFSCVCKPLSLGVGASGALYGLLGVQAINIIMNWKTLLRPCVSRPAVGWAWCCSQQD